MTHAYLQRPRPAVDRDSEPFWNGLRRHEVMIQGCPSCGKLTHPPTPMCPHCRSLERDWRKCSGKGKLYSWTVVHRPSYPYYKDKVPYAIALIELEEGIRVVGAIDCPHDRLRDGLAVVADFEDVDDELTLLRFRIAA